MTKRISTRKSIKQFIARNKGALSEIFQKTLKEEMETDTCFRGLDAHHVAHAATAVVRAISEGVGMRRKIVWQYFEGIAGSFGDRNNPNTGFYYYGFDVVANKFTKHQLIY